MELALNPEQADVQLLEELMQELRQALADYWHRAGAILAGSGVEVAPEPPGYYDLERNFFSMLFLYSFRRAGLDAERRILYATVNQCLRGMVTGCDNLLDDEYKQTLDTTLPRGGTKFRSVLDIMIADRILFELFSDAAQKGLVTPAAVGVACAESLRALIRSGAQEAGEEQGVNGRLEPELVLKQIHHYKTGLLFQAPWALPLQIEQLEHEVAALMLDALYRIGLGCQIMDDMVDLAADIRDCRHNYLASLIAHHSGPEYRDLVGRCRDPHFEVELSDYPAALAAASRRAGDFLSGGLGALFDDGSMVRMAREFMARQIGAQNYV